MYVPSWQPKTLMERFNWIMQLMIRSCVGVKKEYGTVARPLVLLMQHRFTKLRNAVTAAYASGPIPLRTRSLAASKPKPAKTHTATPADLKPIPEYILPRCFGWVLRMLPGTPIDTVQSQFKHLLTDPEMHALAATSRPVGSALRALCHILGLKQPDYLRLPRPRRRKAADESSRKAADDVSRRRVSDPSSPKPLSATPRRTRPPRPSPFPVAPPFPTPEQQKRAFRQMFIDHREPQRVQDFTPIHWTYIHPQK